MDKYAGLYIAVSFLVSLFYGSFAGRIWLVNWKDYKFLQRVYQFIFNFLGGVYGFSILYYLLYKLHSNIAMSFADVVLLIVAIIGTTGQLPSAIVNFTRNIGSRVTI